MVVVASVKRPRLTRGFIMGVVCGIAVRTVAMALAMLAAFKTAFLARSYKAIKLYKTSVAIGPTTTVANLSEADFSGYAPVAISALSGPAKDAANNAYLTTAEAYFTNNGGGVGNQIYAAGIVGTIAGSTLATGTVGVTGGVVDTPVITAAGAGYLVPPKITVAGAPGVGAQVVATINGAGEVDSITVIDGGSGYVAPTITIEPPVELLAGLNFDSPVPMIAATDALPVVVQINAPSGL